MKPCRIQHCLLLAVLLVSLVVAVSSAPAEPQTPLSNPTGPAKNIILLIGDGMGFEVIGLLRDYARILENRSLHLESAMDEGDVALVHVSPADVLVIDSAAAATALATGIKTRNGTISMTPDGESAITILELAARAGKRTGIVTTTSISHATPAAFAAHAFERESEAEIAAQMADAGVDVLMGGGLAYWIPDEQKASEFAPISRVAGADLESKRRDDINLLEKMENSGYQILHNRDQLLAAEDSDKILGLFAASHMPYALDRQPKDAANTPSLAQMTRLALTALSRDEKGFFLMVEGGRIDHAAHNHDAGAMLAEALEFDEAVGAALDFARAHPQTAIFITADHATAAPTLSARYSDVLKDTFYPGEGSIKKIALQDISFEYLLLLLESEPSAGNLKQIVAKHFGVQITKRQAAEILRAGPLSAFHVTKPRYREYAYPMQALARVLGTEYSMAWATVEHYSEPVILVRWGAAGEPAGYLEQTEIFEMMKKAAGY
ncbi:MAG: hypothetical protein C4520_19830 [Candidatus Abyssobacteria bacterium SURF_5]|uniref:Alkaline phosphatase n=1 Tax=Abyssobacteria bacterium (strain SURF_5) TaxID=2093360 RepID=A0A3A4NAL4_ABYX5|nr:MAG: hypothetical protein C4520_19830 [Candidatus Abyssubacteria bacterium SURF_5]